MQPGDLVCFNNRRVLHGRKAFTLSGGIRFFMVCTCMYMQSGGGAVASWLVRSTPD